MARTRRNPPMVVNVGIAAAVTALAGFVYWKFVYNRSPVYGPDGVVRKAGRIPASAITPGKTGSIYFAVGSKVPTSWSNPSGVTP